MPLEEITYREYVKEKLDTIDKKVTFTNGKVRKIIIALVLLSGMMVGLGFDKVDILLKILFA